MLDRNFLQKQLESAFGQPSPVYPVPAGRIAEIYANYAAGAQSCSGIIVPGQTKVHQAVLAVALTAAFATSGFNYITTYTKIADAMSVFWLAPPMNFTGPTPGIIIAAPARPLRDALIFGHILALHLSSDSFDVSPGQTAFGLSKDHSGAVNLVLNGMIQRAGIDFSVTGSEVDWISPDFSLSPSDVIDLQYMTTTVIRDNIDPQKDNTAAVAAAHWAWALHFWTTGSVIAAAAPPSACSGPIS